MGKSKRENQIKISYFLSSFTDYRSIFYVLEQYAQVGGGERGEGGGEGRSPELWDLMVTGRRSDRGFSVIVL